jgi:hypothetical protein
MTKINKSFLQESSIDSLRYRIELEKVEIIDKNLLAYIVNQKVNTETGEIIEESFQKTNSLKIKLNGYIIHFAINKILDSDKTLKSYLTILINSKILENDYLQGIRMNNIEKVYNRIIDCKVINITFEDFLSKGKVSDVDIKKDVEISKEDFIKGMLELDRNTLTNKKEGFGVSKWTNKNNVGIQWQRRETATNSKPYIKLYYKQIEAIAKDAKQLNENETPFFDTHIGLNNLKNIVRIETTMKSILANQYNFKDNTLLTLLKATQSDLNEILVKSLNANLEPRKLKVRNVKQGLKPLDNIIYIHLLNMVSNQKFTFDYSLEYTLAHFTNKVEKSRMKKKLIEVYEMELKGKEQEKKAIKLSSFFQTIGWN